MLKSCFKGYFKSKIFPEVLPRRTFSSSPLCVNWCPCSSCPHEGFPGKVLLVLHRLDPSLPSVGSLVQLTFPGHSCSLSPGCTSGSPGSRCSWPGGCTQVPVGVWGGSCSRAPPEAGTGLQEHLDHPWSLFCFQNPQHSPQAGAVVRTCKHLDMAKTA